MAEKPQILVATTNPGKMSELIALFGPLGDKIQWKSLQDFPKVEPVEEDGNTFAKNSQKKALGYSKATGLMTLADDSGLVIDALDGQPGVHSARFAGVAHDPLPRSQLDQKNYEKVLHLMKSVPDNKRTARFVCYLSLATEKEVLLEAEGTVEGTITRSPQGCGGFGYDPVFWIPAVSKTAAQLEPEEKNKISHRADAAEKFKSMLTELLGF